MMGSLRSSKQKSLTKHPGGLGSELPVPARVPVPVRVNVVPVLTA